MIDCSSDEIYTFPQTKKRPTNAEPHQTSWRRNNLITDFSPDRKQAREHTHAMQPTLNLLARTTTGIRRLKLTTKQVNGGYYKGTGSGSMGRHTKHGGFVIDWNKVRTYVVPNMENFQVGSEED